MTEILCQPWLWLRGLDPIFYLIVITAYYAYHVGSQSKLLYNNARRDQLTKELVLVIQPLKTIMREHIRYEPSENRVTMCNIKWKIDHDFKRTWEYPNFRRTPDGITKTLELSESELAEKALTYQRGYAEDKKFKDLEKDIIQYKYLCPKDLRQRVDDFLMSLEDMERSARAFDIAGFEVALSEAITNLFGEPEPRWHGGMASGLSGLSGLSSGISGLPSGITFEARGGAVERRRSEISKELDRLEPKEGRIKRCMSWIGRRSFYNKTREHFIEAKTFCRKVRNKI